MSADIKWHSAGRNNWLSVAKPDERFLVEFNQKANTLYTNFEEAAFYNAQCIYEDWKHKDLYVSLSGGLDSELVANSFYNQGIPFTPLIIDLGELNYLERWYAEYWCNTKNIKPLIITVSADEMFKNIFVPYMKFMPKHSQYYATLITLFAADYVDTLFGAYVTGLSDPNWDLDRKEFFCDYIDFPLDIHRAGKHPTGFFSYTPEVMLSYSYQFDTTLDEQYNKINFYKVPPRVKYNYAYELGNYIPKLANIIALREKSMNTPVPHWYGSKSEFIELLS